MDTTGAVVASYDYTAFGEVLNQSQPSGWIFNHRAFGEIQDPNLGFTYLRARWLNNATGRFESRDPWGGNGQDPRTIHRYSYAALNPIGNHDPNGTEFTLIELVASISILGLVAGAEIAQAKSDDPGAKDAILPLDSKGVLSNGDFFNELSQRFHAALELVKHNIRPFVMTNPAAPSNRSGWSVEEKSLAADEFEKVLARMTFVFMPRTVRTPDGKLACGYTFKKDWPSAGALPVYVLNDQVYSPPGVNACGVNDGGFIVHEAAHPAFYASLEDVPREWGFSYTKSYDSTPDP